MSIFHDECEDHAAEERCWSVPSKLCRLLVFILLAARFHSSFSSAGVLVIYIYHWLPLVVIT